MIAAGRKSIKKIIFLMMARYSFITVSLYTSLASVNLNIYPVLQSAVAKQRAVTQY